MYTNLEDCLSVAKTDDGKFIVNLISKKKKEKKDKGGDDKDVPCGTMEGTETKTEVALTIDDLIYKIKEHLKGSSEDKKKRDDNYDEEL